MGLIRDLLQQRHAERLADTMRQFEAYKSILTTEDARPEAKEYALQQMIGLTGMSKKQSTGLVPIFKTLLGIGTEANKDLLRTPPFLPPSDASDTSSGAAPAGTAAPMRFLLSPEEKRQQQEANVLWQAGLQSRVEDARTSDRLKRLEQIKDQLTPEQYQYLLAAIRTGVELPAQAAFPQPAAHRTMNVKMKDGRVVPVIENPRRPGEFFDLAGNPIDPSGIQQVNVSAESQSAEAENRRLAFAAYAQKLGKTPEQLTPAEQVAALKWMKETTEPSDVALLRSLNAQLAQARLREMEGAEGLTFVRNPALGSGERDEALLRTQPEGVQQLVRGLVDYRIPLPSGFALRSPYWQRVLALASAYDPTFDASNYQARMRLRQDFLSGKAAQNIRSLNTAIGHLHTLNQAANALNNTNWPKFNTIANWMRSNMGDPRVVRFNMAANAVESELAALFKGTGATDQEIKAWRANLSASQSPEQLKGAIDQALELLASRMQALKNQWEVGMGRPKDFHFLTPGSRKALAHLSPQILKEDTAAGQGTTNNAPREEDWRKPPRSGSVLPEDKARQYLNLAGGDKNRARELARQDGWTVK